jgi:peptidoglycan/xylan/chitin deacetylase (PgdA/CDA1 family)
LRVTKPFASLSLDLDNQWSYMKTHGDAGWDSFPSYLDLVIPRVLEILERRKLGITFFVVGQDAALAKNREALGLLGKSGHEIGNHSFHHEPWLHLYARDEIEREIVEAEEAIAGATGQRARGFRGPGYSLSPNTLKVLSERGYLYDASTLPTFLGPAARAYYFFKSRLGAAEREQRRALFGGLKDGLRPLKPYRWLLDSGDLIELPVTTMPFFRVPFHFSYVLYLSGYSRSLAGHFSSALRPSAARHRPSLRSIRWIFSAGRCVGLEFFPGMSQAGGAKVSWSRVPRRPSVGLRSVLYERARSASPASSRAVRP